MEVIDLYGSNAIVVCPECGGHYIVCDFLDKRGPRRCPHCNAANGITYAEAHTVKNNRRTAREANYQVALEVR